MKVDFEKFLALSLVLAGTAGCASDDGTESNDDTDRTADQGGGGADGAGADGTGGAGGAVGGGAGATSQDICVGGDTAATVDCEALPFSSDDCAGESPLGVDVCLSVKMHAAGGIADAVGECLADIDVADSCGDDHVAEVQGCYDAVLAVACDNELAETTCADLSGVCEEVDATECAELTIGLSDFGLEALEACAEGATGTDCGATVQNCVSSLVSL